VVRRPAGAVGPIATGDAMLAAQAMGADFAYIGSAFIATDEARAMEAYKQCIVDSNSDDIVYSNLFTGVHGNYLKPHPQCRHGPGPPARERPQQDELRRRQAPRRPGRTSGAAARASARSPMG
jgi:NAD(P)H-dependent flavin oxidoreductase YrpB (nitropropane dioxygenase family)